jgi:hypothetical protein
MQAGKQEPRARNRKAIVLPPEKEKDEEGSLIREKGEEILHSAFQFPCKSQELEIFDEKHLEGFHQWTGVVAQVIERLLCKCKTLSSNPYSQNRSLAKAY